MVSKLLLVVRKSDIQGIAQFCFIVEKIVQATEVNI